MNTPQRRREQRDVRWLEIVIDIHPVAREAASAFLFDLGCEGVVSEDFDDQSLKAYLPFQKNPETLRSDIEAFLHTLGDIFPEARSPELRIQALEDQDWAVSWRRFFKPLRVTPGLTVFPAWDKVPASLTGHAIRIDPGPAFGTGQHPTTRMCLEAMESGPRNTSWTMLDVGTGSGILAMYGALLGAKRVLAIDTDVEALRWAKRNMDLNGLKGAIEISSVSLHQVKGPFSLLAANLILGEILRLFPLFPPLLIPGGRIILSGLLREQIKEVKRRLEDHGFCHVDMLEQEEWACLIATRGSGG
ncbi:MAG: 50S ribosomal protein L11 methyltransferase [Deltaproteobacteria bacterium]|nr:50S ribosomal protein L11 methyltransferase [Deltaproteobacteria bacterium]